MSDLESNLARLHFGDLVRIPKRKTVFVVVGHAGSGRNQVAMDMPRDLGPRLTIQVDDESIDRALDAGLDPFAPTLAVLFEPVTGGRRTAEPPLERVEDPVRWLRLQPPTPVVFALLAWHTRDRQMELEREGFGLADAVARMLREAGAGEVDTLA